MKKNNPSLPFLKNMQLLDLSKLVFDNSRAFAQKMDEEDPLAIYKEHFNFPIDKEGKKSIYFCGNSLGIQPKTAQKEVDKVMDQWKNAAVKGHFDKENAWVPFHLTLKEMMSKIVGAHASEVTIMNTLSVNLHLMLTSFYRPTGKRTKILVEPDIFPSDRYALESHLHWHGYNIKDHLIHIPKAEYQENLRKGDIKKIIDEQGDEIALIMLGGVNYYTGQILNIREITEWGHEKGCTVGFDLAHAAGNIPLNLHDDGVDFAVWCTYKYLNSGPGSIAGAFVHEKHGSDQSIPKFKGWWGHNAEIRFGMREDFDPMPGIESWQISCQPILSLAPVKAALEIFDQAGMKALRNKSILLTGYLEFLLAELNNKKIKIITPNLQLERGCQLSILIEEGDKSIYNKLIEQGIVVDWRNPNVIRVAPTPLYNGFEEVFTFVQALKMILN